MSGRGDHPGDLPDRAPPISSDSELRTNGLAREWASCDERDRADQLFEALVRAVEAELLTSARGLARKIVGPDDVDDAINTVWLKLLAKQKAEISGGFDPRRGTFAGYFFTILHHTCHDIRRRRQTAPQPSPVATTYGDPSEGLFADVAGPEEEIVQRLESIHERIIAAIELLNLSDSQRDMLRLLLDIEEPAAPADPKAAATARQQKKRLRDKVASLAGLTAAELEVVLLVRTHHTVAAAGAAAPGADVRGLFASAKRKVFALFDIETEG